MILGGYGLVDLTWWSMVKLGVIDCQYCVFVKIASIGGQWLWFTV
jgi:hypothetical protein